MADEPNELDALPSNWPEMTSRQRAEWLYHHVFCATPDHGRNAWIRLVARLLEKATQIEDTPQPPPN